MKLTTISPLLLASALVGCQAQDPGLLVDRGATDSAVYSTLLSQLGDGGAIVSTTPEARCTGPQPLRQYLVSTVRWTNISEVEEGATVLAYNHNDNQLSPTDEGYRVGRVMAREENSQLLCPGLETVSNHLFLLRVGGFSRIKEIEPEEEFIGRLSNPATVEPSPASVDLFPGVSDQ